MKQLVKDLRHKEMLSFNGEEMLNKTFAEESIALFKRKGSRQGSAFPPELKLYMP